jgi:hypothetical protein
MIHVRLANGQRVSTNNKVAEVPLTIAHHDCFHSFHVLRDWRAADIVLGLLWLDDK